MQDLLRRLTKVEEQVYADGEFWCEKAVELQHLAWKLQDFIEEDTQRTQLLKALRRELPAPELDYYGRPAKPDPPKT